MCLEAADRTLGGQIHAYANVLAVGHGFTAPRADLTDARNTAQTLANSLEILGDAQPTQANYNQVLNTFNVNSAISQLQGAVRKANGRSGDVSAAPTAGPRPRPRRRCRAGRPAAPGRGRARPTRASAASAPDAHRVHRARRAPCR